MVVVTQLCTVIKIQKAGHSKKVSLSYINNIVVQSCLTLRDPMDCSPPGSSVLGILQARILEWVAMPSSRGSSDPGIEPVSLMSPALRWHVFFFNY